MHLPVAQAFIDSINTPSAVRRACIQTLVNRTKHLISTKPDLDVTTRVVACITLSKLWDSQIIVFFGDNYFNSFFDRNDEVQTWTLLPLSISIKKEWNIDIPEGLEIRGYSEKIIDEYDVVESEIWFIGELI